MAEFDRPTPGEAAADADRREREREWVMRLRTGDERALAEIFRAYYTPLTRYAESIVHSRDTALDIVSDVFHALWVKRAQFALADLRAYLVTATRNRAFDREQRRRLEESMSARFEAAGWAPELGTTGQQTPDEMLTAREEARDLAERVARVYAELPPRTREVVDRWVNGFTYKEIGRVLAMSAKTVDSHLQRAKQLFRRIAGNDV